MGTRTTSSGRTYRTSSGRPYRVSSGGGMHRASGNSSGSKKSSGGSSYVNKAYELEEIKDQIKELTQQALRLIPKNTTAYTRAKSYWYAHILGALDKDNEFMGGSMFNMQDTIDELMEM